MDSGRGQRICERRQGDVETPSQGAKRRRKQKEFI